jgi:AcrR family transcriptional regulator
MSRSSPKPSLRDQAKAAMRQGLLEIANELLETEGAVALSTRRIAERAGTSTTALYTLFGGKDGLTEALYLEGFARLGRTLEAVEGRENPLEQILELAHIYRQFAKQNAAYYALMFERVIPGFEPSPAARAQAWGSLQPLIAAVQWAKQAQLLGNIKAEELAMRIWVVSHGLVSLELSGYMPEAVEAATMHQQVIEALLEAAK